MLVGWKTHILSFAIFALGIMDYLDPQLVANMFPPERIPMALGIYAIVKSLMHQVTVAENKSE